jgi:hypothetical protein
MQTKPDSQNVDSRHGWFMKEFLPDGLPKALYKFSAKV